MRSVNFSPDVWGWGDYRNVRGQGPPHTYYLSIHQSKPSVWLGTGGEVWLSADNTIPLNEWSHVAAVYDFDKELRLYINGELDAAHPVKGEIETNLSSDHWFGNRLDGPWPYGGMLDEIAIYNRALTEGEIQQDMNGVLASVSQLGKLTTTWGYLKMIRSF